MKFGRQFGRNRRGSIALWVAVSAPALMMTTGLGLEVGTWAVTKTELTVAADAAAAAGAIAYGKTASAQTAAGTAANVAELNGVAGAAARQWASSTQTLTDGSMTAKVGTGITNSSRTAVTVTVSRTLPASFSGFLLDSSSRTITVSSVAEVWSGTATTGSGACVLALDGSATNAIKVANMGMITATGCGIYANSNASTAIYLNSGTIKGDTVGAVGGIAKSNSGSNTFSPWPASPYGSAQANPFTAMATPSPGTYTCHTPPSTSYSSTPRQQTPGVYCGDTSFGGNGTSDQFAPGIYYILNGNLNFKNANILPATDVSFVLIGTTPGALNYGNSSNTEIQLSAPTSGPTAGILFWQTCGSSGTSPASTISEGSTLTVSGSIYLPCGALSVSNHIYLNTASGSTMRVVANTIDVASTAHINAVAQAVASAAQMALVQ